MHANYWTTNSADDNDAGTQTPPRKVRSSVRTPILPVTGGTDPTSVQRTPTKGGTEDNAVAAGGDKDTPIVIEQ